MIHNVTEGLGIAAPAAESGSRFSVARLAALAVIAGASTAACAPAGSSAASSPESSRCT